MNGWLDGMDRYIRLDRRQTYIHIYVRTYKINKQELQNTDNLSLMCQFSLETESYYAVLANTIVSGFFMLLLFLLFVFEAGSQPLCSPGWATHTVILLSILRAKIKGVYCIQCFNGLFKNDIKLSPIPCPNTNTTFPLPSPLVRMEHCL